LATFLPQNVKIRSYKYVKVIASQRRDVFETRCALKLILPVTDCPLSYRLLMTTSSRLQQPKFHTVQLLQCKTQLPFSCRAMTP